MRGFVYGKKIGANFAIKNNIIQAEYKNDSEGEAYIQQFAKEFSPRAANRKVIYEMKSKLHKSTIDSISNEGLSPNDTV